MYHLSPLVNVWGRCQDCIGGALILGPMHSTCLRWPAAAAGPQWGGTIQCRPCKTHLTRKDEILGQATMPLHPSPQLHHVTHYDPAAREGEEEGPQFAPLYFAPKHLLVCDGLPLMRVLSW